MAFPQGHVGMAQEAQAGRVSFLFFFFERGGWRVLVLHGYMPPYRTVPGSAMTFYLSVTIGHDYSNTVLAPFSFCSFLKLALYRI